MPGRFASSPRSSRFSRGATSSSTCSRTNRRSPSMSGGGPRSQAKTGGSYASVTWARGVRRATDLRVVRRGSLAHELRTRRDIPGLGALVARCRRQVKALVAASVLALLHSVASSHRGPAVDERPVRRPATRAPNLPEQEPNGGRVGATRVTGRVVRIERGASPAGAYWLRLFGNALEGGAEGRGETVDFRVKGGVGRFEWALLAAGYEPATGIVDILEGETASIGVVRLVPAAAILEGRVLDAVGRPVEGATVWLHGPAFRPAFPLGSSTGLEREGRTDSAGRYRFERLRAGDRFVEVGAENLPPMPAVAVRLPGRGLRQLQISPSVGEVRLRVRGEWRRPFHLVLTDEGRRIVVDWPIVPPGWSREPGRMSSSPWLGCGMREFQVVELRPAPGGRGLLPPVQRPWVTRGREASEVLSGGDGTTVLIRDVPASPLWRAGVRRPDARGVEPAEFELVPGGHVVLDVWME
jgi:hypothetical protein